MPGAVSESPHGCIYVQDFAHARRVVLCRPQKMNALSLHMVEELISVYKGRRRRQWIPGEEVAVVILRGEGDRSFCSGGDIVSIAQQNNLDHFLYNTYQLDYFILQQTLQARLVQVALWNGYVMGGGVGVSVHSKYRVCTDNTVFAMPEVRWGMFPDNGIAWLFHQLPCSWVGLYVGLTGSRVYGADVMHLGLATHYVTSDQMPALEKDLCAVTSAAQVAEVLDGRVHYTPPLSFDKHVPLLQRAFTLHDHLTVEQVAATLEEDGSDFALDCLAGMAASSPTALKVTMELMKRTRRCTSPLDLFQLEFTVIQRIAASQEFCLGVKTKFIERCSTPVWSPVTLAEVTPTLVANYFNPEGLPHWDPE